MTSLLVPIDGSASALRALDHAMAQLRKAPGARVELVNVQSPPVQPWPSKLVSPDLVARELRAEGEKVLAAALARLRDAGLAGEGHVRIGHPAEEIAACAVECGCDGVVMGTRGLGPAAGLLLGSVATKVVHLARVPVTLVK